MIFLRTEDGAAKWALRLFLLEDDTLLLRGRHIGGGRDEGRGRHTGGIRSRPAANGEMGESRRHDPRRRPAHIAHTAITRAGAWGTRTPAQGSGRGTHSNFIAGLCVEVRCPGNSPFPAVTSAVWGCVRTAGRPCASPCGRSRRLRLLSHAMHSGVPTRAAARCSRGHRALDRSRIGSPALACVCQAPPLLTV